MVFKGKGLLIKLVCAVVLVWTPFTPVFSQENNLNGTKVKDSEDLPDEAKKILSEKSGDTPSQEATPAAPQAAPEEQLTSGEEETNSEQSQTQTPMEKVDIVITKPDTLEERARKVRQEIEFEKIMNARQSKAETSKLDGSGLGQSGSGDSVGDAGGGGGGGMDGEAVVIQVVPGPTLKERAEMEKAELVGAPGPGMGPGAGGGEGGGTGGGSGSGMGSGETTDAGAAYKTPKTKVCKGKSAYDCMAMDGGLLEKAEAERAQMRQGSSRAGEKGSTQEDGEHAFKRVRTRFKTQKELELEAHKILSNKDGQDHNVAVGESVEHSTTDQTGEVIAPSAPTFEKSKTLEERAAEIKEELKREQAEKNKGSGQGTKDLQ